MRFFKNTHNNHIYSIVELQKTEDQSDYTMIDLSTNARHPYFDSICYVSETVQFRWKLANTWANLFNIG